MAGGIYIPLSS